MGTLLSFAAAVIMLRLGGALLRRGDLAWGSGLLAYAVASGALAWGSAHGWDRTSFRVYYLAGGLLTAPLLGVGSLLIAGRRWAAPVGLFYAGVAAGIALTMGVHGTFGTAIPSAQDHLTSLPRVVAIAGNSAGTLAVIVVALATFRSRWLGNTFLLAGIGAAALGSALAGTGTGAASSFAAVAAVLLYVGVAPPSSRTWFGVAEPGSRVVLRRARRP